MIGTRFLCHLIKINPSIRVRCLVRRIPVGPQHKNIQWVQGDLLNESDCEEFVAGLQTIAHFAQSNAPAISDRHWPSDFVTNVLPTLNLLGALRKRKEPPCHLIFPSSGGAVYGNHPDKKYIFTEKDSCHPLSPYGIQKLAIEQYLRIACNQGWLRSTILRISNTYGIILPKERRQGLIGVAIARALAGQKIPIFGSLDIIRDYIHVDDVISAFLEAMDYAKDFDIFNISTAKGYPVSQVLEIIKKITRLNIKTENSVFGNAVLSLVPRVVLSNERAYQQLNWQPKIDLESGISSIINYSR
jgi:UDP-glucose 4-epimerase